MKNASLKAVHDDDLFGLLSSLGVYESLVQGKCSCNFCGETITIDNLGSIFPLNNTICFSCNKEACLQQMIEIGGSKNDNK